MDWDFRNETTRSYYPHNICWYPSRFLPQIPAQFIAALSDPGDLVYDPFSGCGTTVVESIKLGRRAIANDISPVAIFLTRTKARIVSNEYVDVGFLREFHDTAVSGDRGLFLAKRPSEQKESGTELGKWYHENTLAELVSIKAAIDQMPASLTADAAKAAFLAILMPASGLESDRPYTYYADNVKPKVPIKKDANALFRSRLARIIAGQKALTKSSATSDWAVETANILKMAAPERETVDLVVTSPPYLGVTDYVTGFRLAHLWYPSDEDIDAIKRDEIGARWKRKRRSSLTDYIEEMGVALRLMTACLKTGGHICLVVGEAKRYSDAVLQALTQYAEEILGLTTVSTFGRKISQNFFLHQDGGVATEDILIFRK